MQPFGLFIALFAIIAIHPITVEGQTHCGSKATPCVNGGVCNNATGVCACSGGWAGALCSRNDNVCTVSAPCFNAATCEDKPTSYTCHCLTGFSGSDCETNDGMTVTCDTLGTMTATFDLTSMDYIDVTRTHLRSEACTGRQIRTTLVITTAVAACGTTSSQDASDVKYSNEVRSYVTDVTPFITREYELRLPFYCKFPRIDLHIQDGVHFQPKQTVSIVEDGSVSTYTLQLSMYESSAYSKKVTTFPYSTDLKLPLYFKVEFVTVDPNLSMYIDNCKATGNTTASSTPSYPFLTAGCGVDKTLVYTHGSDKATQNFRIDAFRFTKVGKPLVYVHCYIKVCVKGQAGSKCVVGPKCGGSLRRKRDAEEKISDETIVSVGPLNIRQNKEGRGATGAQSSNIVVPVTATLAVVAVVVICVLVAAIVYRRQTRRRGNNSHSVDTQTGVHQEMVDIEKPQC